MTIPVLSIQLYSVNDLLEQEPDDTLGRLAALGIRRVETFDFVRRAPRLRQALDRHGLSAPTGHATLLSDGLRRGDHVVPAPSHAETFEAARELGTSVIIDPFVPPARWKDATEIARTAELLNRTAAEASEHGLLVGYHNHAHEFAHEFDGLSAYELFVEQLDPGVVLELDAYWAAAAGQDVPALVERQRARIHAVHVKDGRIDAGDPFERSAFDPASGGDPFGESAFDPASLGQVPAGDGEVPLEAVLAAATAAEYAVIEFDHYAGEILEGIARSVSFLAARGIR